MILLVADVCFILHNLLASMRKRGELAEETVGRLDDFYEDLPGMHGAGDTSAPVGHCVGLGYLVERSDEVMSESGDVALRVALIDHLWTVRGETQQP